LAEQRERTGIGSNTETQTGRASTANYLDASQQATLAHQSAVRALELLLGSYPGASLQVADALPAMPAPIPAGIPADMLNRRPDLHAAERRVAAAFDRVGEARAAMLPTLSLSAGYGRLSNDVIETREDLEQTTSSVAVTGIMPLYTGGALTGQVRLRSAEQKQAVADYARRALLALAEVEEALSAERLLAARASALDDGLLANQKATVQVRDSWRIGKSDMRAVHTQEMATLAAQSALLSVQRERLSRRVDLHLALGGDFGPPPALASAAPSQAASDPSP
jgi:outer membrane protein TolC